MQQQGFILIEQNFLTPLGEIDLIGMLDEVLVFVEVKARNTASFGSALEMVTKSKQNKNRKAAQIFLQRYTRYQNVECRFDVVGITAGKIEWIKAAF